MSQWRSDVRDCWLSARRFAPPSPQKAHTRSSAENRFTYTVPVTATPDSRSNPPDSSTRNILYRAGISPPVRCLNTYLHAFSPSNPQCCMCPGTVDSNKLRHPLLRASSSHCCGPNEPSVPAQVFSRIRGAVFFNLLLCAICAFDACVADLNVLAVPVELTSMETKLQASLCDEFCLSQRPSLFLWNIDQPYLLNPFLCSNVGTNITHWGHNSGNLCSWIFSARYPNKRWRTYVKGSIKIGGKPFVGSSNTAFRERWHWSDAFWWEFEILCLQIVLQIVYLAEYTFAPYLRDSKG